jgi:hypothetical protein
MARGGTMGPSDPALRFQCYIPFIIPLGGLLLELREGFFPILSHSCGGSSSVRCWVYELYKMGSAFAAVPLDVDCFSQPPTAPSIVARLESF